MVFNIFDQGKGGIIFYGDMTLHYLSILGESCIFEDMYYYSESFKHFVFSTFSHHSLCRSFIMRFFIILYSENNNREKKLKYLTWSDSDCLYQ